eukprot:gene31953-33737_t
MGNVQPGGFEDAVDEVDETLKGQAGKEGIRLYNFVRAGTAGNWEVVTKDAKPVFFDSEEDSGKTADWFLEIDSAEISVRVDQAMGYVADIASLRITFNANEEVFCHEVSLASHLQAEPMDLDPEPAEPMDLDPEPGPSRWTLDPEPVALRGPSRWTDPEPADRWDLDPEPVRPMDLDPEPAEPMDLDPEPAEPMDLDPEPVGPESQTPDHFKEKKALQRDDDDAEGMRIHGIVMGELDNNYLMEGATDGCVSEITVTTLTTRTHYPHLITLQVEGGGVSDKGITFSLSTPQGKAGPSAGFTPSKALLAQGERRMNLLTEGDRNKLHQADIETGKIISTWTFAKDEVKISMSDISHDTKASGAEERSTFLGLDNNRLCRWESPFAEYGAGKDYSRGTNFTCMATSGDGYVVVGSKDGKIRMYNNKSLTRANTSIPGLGAPITSVDVTYDGKWVVATTDHYLIVVKTTFTSDKGDPCTAFTKSMGTRGSTPRLLRLRPEDSKLIAGKPFQKGKFTWITEQGHSERWIVASDSKLIVGRSFQKGKFTWITEQGRSERWIVASVEGQVRMDHGARPLGALDCGQRRTFQKDKFTWIKEQGHSERWIVASFGKFSVVWNFAKIKTSGGEVLSFGGLPTCMDYILTAKTEEVVAAAFVHQKYTSTPTRGDADQTSLVVATPHSLFNVGSNAEY